MKRLLRFSLVLGAALLIAASCTPDPDDPDSQPLGTPRWFDDNPPADVIDGYIIVDTNQIDADQVVDIIGGGRAVEELAELEFIDQELLRSFSESALFSVLNDEVRFIDLEGQGIDAALIALEAADVPLDAVAPAHRVGAMAHWSAFPGTQPVAVDAGEWDKGDSSLPNARGEALRIGLVDTGIADGSPNAIGVGHEAVDAQYSECDNVLHGEASASAMKQVNPSAEVISANAFPGGSRCWVTNEVHVLAATSFLLDQGDYDVITYALGAAAYHTEQTQKPHPPVLLRLMIRDLNVVASAGNSDRPEQVYPAAFSGVAAVHAADPGGNATVWDSDGNPVGPNITVDKIAPGCALILQGVSDGSGGLDTSQVIVWAGSSFAAPIYAAVEGNVDPADPYDEILPARMNNHATKLYPSAPTDC